MNFNLFSIARLNPFSLMALSLLCTGPIQALESDTFIGATLTLKKDIYVHGRSGHVSINSERCACTFWVSNETRENFKVGEVPTLSKSRKFEITGGDDSTLFVKEISNPVIGSGRSLEILACEKPRVNRKSHESFFVWCSNSEMQSALETAFELKFPNGVKAPAAAQP